MTVRCRPQVVREHEPLRCHTSNTCWQVYRWDVNLCLSKMSVFKEGTHVVCPIHTHSFTHSLGTVWSTLKMSFWFIFMDFMWMDLFSFGTFNSSTHPQSWHAIISWFLSELFISVSFDSICFFQFRFFRLIYAHRIKLLIGLYRTVGGQMSGIQKLVQYIDVLIVSIFENFLIIIFIIIFSSVFIVFVGSSNAFQLFSEPNMQNNLNRL